MPDQEVLYSVPDAMQRLVRLTVRGFYGIEFGLAVDVLIRNACVKEEDIQNLLKFDKRHLRTILNTLKGDKILKSRNVTEIQQETNKLSRHVCFFINYRGVANIIKYKLHKMQKKIESRERDLSNRPSFKCPTCSSTYGDLDVQQLLDPVMGTLHCMFCKAEVIEEKDTANHQDIRTSQARFNEQTEVLYKLLKEVEDVKLADEILDPKPTALNLNNLPGKTGSSRSRNKNEPNWSTKSTSEIEMSQRVEINIGDDISNTGSNQKTGKEIPEWYRKSTVTEDAVASLGASTSAMPIKVPDTDDIATMKRARRGAGTSNETSGDKLSGANEDEVMRLLLVNERPSSSGIQNQSSAPQSSNLGLTQVSTSSLMTQSNHQQDSSEDEFDDVEDDDEADDDMKVTVAGKVFSYHEVAQRGQELVGLMSEKEKEEYIQMGQHFYQQYMND